jgi:hypothetical protein
MIRSDQYFQFKKRCRKTAYRVPNVPPLIEKPAVTSPGDAKGAYPGLMWPEWHHGKEAAEGMPVVESEPRPAIEDVKELIMDKAARLEQGQPAAVLVERCRKTGHHAVKMVGKADQLADAIVLLTVQDHGGQRAGHEVYVRGMPASDGEEALFRLLVGNEASLRDMQCVGGHARLVDGAADFPGKQEKAGQPWV